MNRSDVLRKVLTAENKFTEPQMVGPGEVFMFQAKSVGPESTALVTNGTFTGNITGWAGQNGTANVYGTITAASNVMRLTQPAATPLFCNSYQAITVVPGALYDYSLDVAATDVPALANAKFAIGTTVPVAGAVYAGDVLAAVSIGSAATYADTFKSKTASTVYLVFQNNGAVNDVLDIDNVTVSGGALSGILSVQWLLDTFDPARPNDADTRWTTIETKSIAGTTAVTDHSNVGHAWFRVGFETGNYTDGNCEVLQKTARVSQ